MQCKLWHYFRNPCCIQLCFLSFYLFDTERHNEVSQTQVTWKSWLRKTVHFLPTEEDRNIKWNWQEIVSKPKEHSLHSDVGCCEWQIFIWVEKNNWISSWKRTTGGWQYFSLRSLSNKSLNLHNTFWKVSLLACSSLTVLTRHLLLGQGRKTEELFAKWPFNIQLGSTKTEQNCKVKIAYMQFHVYSLYIKPQKRYKKEHKYWHSNSPAVLELSHYMCKLLKPELMKYLTPTSHSASL